MVGVGNKQNRAFVPPKLLVFKHLRDNRETNEGLSSARWTLDDAQRGCKRVVVSPSLGRIKLVNIRCSEEDICITIFKIKGVLSL